MVEVKDVYAKAKYLPRRHPFQLSNRRQTVQNPSEFNMVLDLLDTVNGNPEKQRGCESLSPHPDRKQPIFGDPYQMQVRNHGCPRL